MENAAATIMAETEADAGAFKRLAPIMPGTPPIRQMIWDSTINRVRTALPRAPKTLQVPISRVHSVTDTSIVFITPIPPPAGIWPRLDLRRPNCGGGEERAGRQHPEPLPEPSVRSVAPPLYAPEPMREIVSSWVDLVCRSPWPVFPAGLAARLTSREISSSRLTNKVKSIIM